MTLLQPKHYYFGSSMSGSFKAPKPEELAAIKRLKERIAATVPAVEHTFTDTAYLRYFRGRKGIEDDAYKALLRHVKWRKDHDVDNIHQQVDQFRKELDANKIVAEGFDLEGRPCVFVHTKNHNKNDRDLVQLKMLIVYTIEKILLRANPEEERILICFDLTGFKMMNMDYDMIKLLINTMDFNYPETLNKSLVINAPYLFYACYAVIQPWLDPVTAAKVAFVNSANLHEFVTFNAPNTMNLPYDGAKTDHSRTHSCPPYPSNSNSSKQACPSPDNSPGRSPAVKSVSERQAEFDGLYNQLHNTENTNEHNTTGNGIPDDVENNLASKRPVSSRWW